MSIEGFFLILEWVAVGIGLRLVVVMGLLGLWMWEKEIRVGEEIGNILGVFVLVEY